MEEVTLDLPRNLFQKPFGFTMDFGGSAIKMLYTSEVEDKMRIHFLTMSREEHAEAFDMLAEKCKGRLEPGTEVHTCGLGGSEFRDLLTEKFGLTFVNTNEIDRMMEGFVFMSKHFAWDDFVKPVSPKAFSEAVSTAMFNKNLKVQMPETNFRWPSFIELDKAVERGGPGGDQKVNYPILIFLIGSGGGCMKVNEDGTYQFCDSSTMAGRAFLGLGSILTDGKTFPEICDLASRGDASKVDITMQALNVNPDDKIYGLIKDASEDTVPIKVFSFGNAVGKNREDFQKEDISRALISMFAETFAARAYMWATIHKVSQVFFIGGFPCANQLIQDDIAKYFMIRRFMSMSDHATDCYFLKFGQQCGSFGTLLMNIQENKDT